MTNNHQLFCFTHAGGTATFFDLIEKDLPQLELVKLEYSGHGERRKEPFYHDFDELAEDLLSMIIKCYKGKGYSLFGYSMGSIALVEVLQRIISIGLPRPSNLFLAAHEPFTKTEILSYDGNELDECVRERTIHYGALPEKLHSNNAFWRTYLPIYRADYLIIAKYQFEELNLHEDIPATIFYSDEDTPLKKMKQWEKYFPCEFFQFSGNHFFIFNHHREIAEIIQHKMGRIV